jgi:capsular polysaccharide biosynthesis protein
MKSQIHIDYKLPVNYQPEWEHLFRPDYKYKTVDLKVRELNNVFVNQSGLVIKNGLLVKGCAPNIGFSNYDTGFYFKHWRKATEQMLVCKYGKSLEAVRLDDNRKYLVIHSPWFSYYFWLTECLPRLLMVKYQLSEVVLLYPSSWKNLTFVNQTLEMFPQLQTYEIPFGKHLFVKNLVMPEVKPWTPMFIPEQIIEVRDLLIPFTEKNFYGKNIYISREDAKFKKIENRDLFEKTIKKYDFEIHIMTGKSIFEQVNLMQNTNYLIATNGAGMANFIFLNRNSCVIELTYEYYIQNDRYKFHFKKILDLLGVDYAVQFCKTDNNDLNKIIGLRNIHVDINELKKNIELISKIKK